MGYLFAFLSAISWAFGTISLALSKHQLNPNVFNLYKNLIGFSSLLIILLISSFLTTEIFWIISYESIFLIILSGILGSGLADQIYIRSLSLIGSNLISVIASSLSIFVLIFALILNLFFPSFFPEQNWPPANLEILGFILIISAIILSSWQKNDYKNAKFQNIILAISAFMLMGLSANLTNSAIYLNTGTTLNIMCIILIRFIPAIIFQCFVILATSIKKDELKSFFNLPSKSIYFASIGSLMISVVAIFFWTAGMKMESNNVTLFSLLAQTSNIMIFICSWLILKERISSQKILAIILSFIGIILIVSS